MDRPTIVSRPNGFAERKDAIAALLDEAVAAGEIAGAVVLVARGDAIDVAAAGWQDLASRIPMRRDTIFRIFSMTKPILAAAALMLVEDGKLELDAPVDPWLPELARRRVLRDIAGPLDDTVPATRAVTLRDLLTMRMGLGMIMAPAGTYPIQAAMEELGLAPSPEPIGLVPDEYMARLGRLPLFHQPGQRWLYHIAADVTAVLVSRVAGQPLGDVLRERLFAPLGMHDTGFHVPADRLDRLATAYRRGGDGVFSVQDSARDGSYARAPAFPSELVSTADDYLAFVQMLVAKGRGPNGRLLSDSSVAAMFNDQIPPAQKAASPFFPGFWEENGWGFGGAVVTRASAAGFPPGSYGWMGGLGTSFVVDPARDLVAILLTQRLMMAPDDVALTTKFQALANTLTETE